MWIWYTSPIRFLLILIWVIGLDTVSLACVPLYGFVLVENSTKQPRPSMTKSGKKRSVNKKTIDEKGPIVDPLEQVSIEMNMVVLKIVDTGGIP